MDGKEAMFLIYRAADEDVSVNALIKDESIWLSQKGMAELFDVQAPAINKHLSNIYAEGELMPDATISKMEIVQQEGSRQVKDILDTYAKKRFSIESIPQELEYRIHNSKEQQIKSYDYFISHSFRDYCTVQSLIDKLNGAGMNVYCDWISDSDYLKRNLVCDATLEVIETRINQSNAVLFIASDYSYSSIWVKYELNYAEERGKTIYYVDTQSVDKDSFAIEVLSDKWFSDTDYKKIKQEGKLW